MLIAKVSQLTGKLHCMTIDVTMAEIHAWENGDKFIQDALPKLSADEREFLMTGITPKEWNAMFGEDEEKGEF